MSLRSRCQDWVDAGGDACRREATEHAIAETLRDMRDGRSRVAFEMAVAEAAVAPDERSALAAFTRPRVDPPADVDDGDDDLVPIAHWKDAEEPAPVLWQHVPEAASHGVVLSIGEVAVLSGPGGAGKSFVTLALARAAAWAHEHEEALEGEFGGMGYAVACGLAVRAGPVVVGSYEDRPVRLAARLKRLSAVADCPGFPEQALYCRERMRPLYSAGVRSGSRGHPTTAWRPFWDRVRMVQASLVVIDPVSVALEGAPVSEVGPVRGFLDALQFEAERAGVGVLLVAHSTKAARDELERGRSPGSGAVAGSAAWIDGVRGVLLMHGGWQQCEEEPAQQSEDDLWRERTLVCWKANYGRERWRVRLDAQSTSDGKFAGYGTPPRTSGGRTPQAWAVGRD